MANRPEGHRSGSDNVADPEQPARPVRGPVPGQGDGPGGNAPSEQVDVVDVAPVASGALSDGGGLSAAVARSRAQVTAGQARLNDLIDKYHDRAVLDVALRIFQRDREAAGTIVGSALAFRLFLFFVPVVLFFVGLIGFLAQWTGPHELNQTAGLTGTLAAQIDTALTQPNTTRWIAVVAGLVGMVWAGRSLSKVMVSASCLAWRLPITTKATVRLIGGIVGLVVGIALVCAITNRVRRDLGLGAASLSFIAVFALYGLAWMAMSMLLPRATKDPGALLPGAVLVGGLLAAMQAVAQLYLPDKLDRTSALYGAIGTTIVTLGWFFLLGRGMVLGMSLNAVIYERFGSISQFVFGLPVIRVLPRKSAWTRDFFDLER